MSHLRAQTGNLKAKRKSYVKLWQSARWHRMTPLQRSALHTAGNSVETHVKGVGVWELDCTRILLGYYKDIIYYFYTDIRSIIFFILAQTQPNNIYLNQSHIFIFLAWGTALSSWLRGTASALWHSIIYVVQHQLHGTASALRYSIGFMV
jgi:hypothetical protein